MSYILSSYYKSQAAIISVINLDDKLIYSKTQYPVTWDRKLSTLESRVWKIMLDFAHPSHDAHATHVCIHYNKW